jgi:S-adenosylmethionine-diacylgycerolhomoserine-N-methlytransferase
MSDAAFDSLDARARMDAIYRWQVELYDATRKFDLLGRDGLIEDLAPPPGGHVLEIGCGTGRNLVKAARRYPHARFFGVDVSEVMLGRACEGVRRAGVMEQVRLARGDATCFDSQRAFGVAAFDRIYFSYTLSMIPGWHDALERSFALLAPGGALHIVDFGDFSRLPGPFGPLMRHWLAIFHVKPEPLIISEVRKLATRTGARIRHDLPFRGYAMRITATRA